MAVECDCYGTVFQSPSGVLGVCRSKQRASSPRMGSGVSVPFRGFRGLQGFLALYGAGTLTEFQSPSGVLGVCRSDMVELRDWIATIGVSVPFRGFRGLQGPPNLAPTE